MKRATRWNGMIFGLILLGLVFGCSEDAVEASNSSEAPEKGNAEIVKEKVEEEVVKEKEISKKEGTLPEEMKKVTKIIDRFGIIQGDITEVKVDAIVNAANKSLLGGGGVDGAIHKAAGPELKEECGKIKADSKGDRCQTGEAKITGGYRLPATYVVHTVGPIWSEGAPEQEKQKQRRLLASCYRSSLELALENKCKTVAFPSISTGIYHYPLEEASGIAVREIKDFLEKHSEMEGVYMVCFDEKTFDAYVGAAEKEFPKTE